VKSVQTKNEKKTKIGGRASLVESLRAVLGAGGSNQDWVITENSKVWNGDDRSTGGGQGGGEICNQRTKMGEKSFTDEKEGRGSYISLTANR